MVSQVQSSSSQVALQVWNSIDESVDVFENKVWKGVEQGTSIVKKSFQITADHNPRVAHKMERVIAGVGLLSAFNFFLALKSIPGHILNLIKNIKLDDPEGIVHSLGDLLAAPFCALDSVIGFAGALAALGAIPIIAFFSLIALPLGIAVLSISAIYGAYKIIHCAIILSQLPKDGKGLLKFIDKKLGVGEFDVKLVNKFTRRTDSKVVSLMKNMKKHLKEHPTDDLTAKKAIKDLRQMLIRKITFESLGFVANIALIITLVVGGVFGLGPAILIPVIGGGRAIAKLGKYVHDEFVSDIGYHLPQYH